VSPEPFGPAKVVLDTDAGVDDAVAIVLTMNSPEVDLLAITTVAGNAPVAECTRNCLLLAELLRPGKPPRVAEGADTPLRRQLVTAPEVHGPDGLGGEIGSLPRPRLDASPQSAVDVLIEAARANPGEAILVATGPLTNVASALRADPEALALYRRVVVMGGAFYVPGNTGPVAEFNFFVDPEAADAVMNARLPITLVPLDATTRAPLREVDLTRRPLHRPPRPRPERDLASILSRALDYYMRREFEESRLLGGYMHDPLAVASAFAPAILTTSAACVRVIVGRDDRGRSALTSPPCASPIEIAFDLDEDAFLTILDERVLTPTFGP
jgi:pyrimidine-specific ribonucleoside hydrolase